MKLVDGIWYPSAEERLHRGHARFRDVSAEIMPYVKSRRTCIQAGGAVGVWPREFGTYFDQVYSAEPNPFMRYCFVKNTADSDNIALLSDAFWSRPGRGKFVELQSNNLGSWYIQEDDKGPISLTTIDSLGAKDVDLIQLDIEGAEVEALIGAQETIKRDRPVLVLEIKEVTSASYGRKPDDVRRFVAKLGYTPAHKFGRDELWVPSP